MKGSISILLAISFGVIHSMASPTLRLDVMKNPISGCINMTTCSYGCGKFSTSSVKHTLTPLCRGGSKAQLPHGSPKNLTIRGTSLRPYLYDEDNHVQFECSHIRSNNGTQFICTQQVEDQVVAVASSTSSSGSVSSSSIMLSRSASASASSSSGSSLVHRLRPRSSSSTSIVSPTTTIEIPPPSTIFSTVTATAFTTPSNTVCINSPGVYNMNHGNGNLDDCCLTSNDCHGSCIKGACDAENNQPPPPACTNTKFFGKKNGKGIDGACCETEQDCLENCVAGVCLTVV